jgi:hypothetical protein
MGAKFGWDFVDPTPIYTYQKASRNLFYHVATSRSTPGGPPAVGALVPAASKK